MNVSVRGEWSGDIDLNDGKLHQMFLEYQGHLESIKEIGLSDSREVEPIVLDLTREKQKMEEELELLTSSMLIMPYFISTLQQQNEFIKLSI